MTAKRRGSVKTWVVAVAGLAAVGVGLRLTVWGGSGEAAEVEVVQVTVGPVVMTIETNGSVEPLSTIQVGSEVNGKVIEVPTDNDQPVRKDQVICRIDPELYQTELDQARAEHARAASALNEARVALEEQTANLPVQTEQALARKEESEAAYEEADYNWNRVRGLAEQGNASAQEIQLTKAAWLRSKAAVTQATALHKLALSNERFLKQRAEQAVVQAEAAEKLAKARVDQAQARVERCTIRSPIDGIVLKRYTDVGMAVVSALQIQPLFLIAPQLDRMRVLAKVSESDINHVEIGQPARFTIEGRGRLAFEGRIIEKRNQPDMIQNVVTYTVVFEVTNDARRTLLPGLTVNVVIECVNRTEAVRIPNSALRFKPPLTLEQRDQMIRAAQWPEAPRAAGGQSYDYCTKTHAWRFDHSADRWTLVPLWIGITDHSETEVLWGAKAGDAFVRKFIPKSTGKFDFKEMLKQADPANRRVI